MGNIFVGLQFHWMKRFAKFEMLREAEMALSTFPARKHCSDLFESKKKYASAKTNIFFSEMSMGLYPTSDPDSNVVLVDCKYQCYNL